MSDIEFSIITPHYTSNSNQKAIDSTRQQMSALSDIIRDPLSKIELLSIDNASEHKETLSMVSDISTVFIKNRVNLGFGAAMNQGMKLARGKYLLLLSNDVLLTDLVALLTELRTTSERFNAIAFPSFSNKKQSLDGLYHGGEWDGSCFLVPKALVDSVGMYNEKFFAYFEDTDWFLRSLCAGFKLMRSGNVLVHHLEETTSRHMEKRNVFFDRSQEIFLKEWGQEGLNRINYDSKNYPEALV